MPSDSALPRHVTRGTHLFLQQGQEWTHSNHTSLAARSFLSRRRPSAFVPAARSRLAHRSETTAVLQKLTSMCVSLPRCLKVNLAPDTSGTKSLNYTPGLRGPVGHRFNRI